MATEGVADEGGRRGRGGVEVVEKWRVCWVEVEGVEPGVAEGKVEQGLVGVLTEWGRLLLLLLYGRGTMLKGVGLEFRGGDRGGLGPRGEEERKSAGWRRVVGGWEDAERDAGEAEEGLLPGGQVGAVS